MALCFGGLCNVDFGLYVVALVGGVCFEFGLDAQV